MKPQERHRDETSPERPWREQGVERSKKPEDATRWGRHPHHEVALHGLMR